MNSRLPNELLNVVDASSRKADFMDLLAASQVKLFGYIFALVPHMEDAHDLYQQTAMVLWQKFGEFESGTNFTAWALKVAQFEVWHYWRSKGSSQVQFSEELVQQLTETQAELSQEAGSDLRAQYLHECLSTLSPSDRSLVDQCYLGGNQIQQVAAALGRSSQSICNSLRRIRVALLTCVEFKLAEESRG